MFYSHYILARKGPLGAVWMAAHLQHKLRKSQVAETNISSSVDSIMLSEVPIALRLSGHLLLGVVRIYSKKVDYLYHDCNEALSKLRSTIASIHVDLPAYASCAAFSSVTLPNTFQLDALDMDYHTAEAPDNHLKPHDQITISDQVPGEGSPYTKFFVNEDFRGMSSQFGFQDFGMTIIEEDVLRPSINTSVGMAGIDPQQSLEDTNNRILEDQFFHETPELQRDVVQPLPSNPVMNDLAGFSVPQNKHVDHVIDEAYVPDIVEAPVLEAGLFHPGSGLATFSGAKIRTPEILPSPPSGAKIPTPEILPSAPSEGTIKMASSPPVQNINRRSRKRKQFDEVIVLSNEDMKMQLQDASKLVRKRKKCPVSILDVREAYKSSHMDQIFLEPSIPDLCMPLQEAFKKVLLAPKVAGPSVEDPQGPKRVQSPDGPSSIPNEEIEEAFVEDRQEITRAPSPAGRSTRAVPNEETRQVPIEDPQEGIRAPSCAHTPSTPSEEIDSFPQLPYPFPRIGDSTYEIPHTVGSTLPSGMTLETENMEWEPPSADLLEASAADQEEQLRVIETPEDLSFLKADAGQSEGPREDGVHTWSVRTRAVAQYLQKAFQSESSKRPLRNLSLNRIIEGRTRNECAKLFFETLVIFICFVLSSSQVTFNLFHFIISNNFIVRVYLFGYWTLYNLNSYKIGRLKVLLVYIQLLFLHA
ncbi:sister chromatid cohesion 1 protein 3 isoform X1 [Amborella trichopoda]|uniref:sister chromatid cohesion 1 protein 3 isoform X1 n=1 Tax=Amborella trichopoda TaxID=13333 RepID=UPI0009BED57D|nr:sister chromatid cohesion 1 protein 3 isoform X1 [Amborella trichopoda]|eukprot:XP_020530537.1 sister chromatid cohesion 1 protein 3 isoform X1 [Amborella trichopoda]